MLEAFQATLSSMLFMFLCISIGFFMKKKSLLPENSAGVLSKLENYLFVPALCLCTFSKYCTWESLKEDYIIIIYSAVTLAVMMIIAIFLSKFFTKDPFTVNVYRYALTFANFAYLGNAIVPIVMGDKALYYYMLFTLPHTAVSNTWGISILNPNNSKKNIWKKLLNPPCVAILIGMIIGLTGVYDYVPTFLTSTVYGLSACMGPVAMLLTGFVIGGYSIKKLLKNKGSYIATALRLVIFPIAIVTCMKLLGADKMIMQFAVFAFGTSLGINTVVFPTAFGADATQGASMAMISNAIGVITIPCLYAAVMYFI